MLIPCRERLVFLSVAAAALCHEYGEKQAFEPEAKRYDGMHSLYVTAERQCQTFMDQTDLAACRRLALELGQEALQENAEWLLQHRHRPIKPPTV